MGVNAANAAGYDGTGQIVGVADTGIGGDRTWNRMSVPSA